MLLGLLLTLNIMVCLALIGVVLLQRSEGGALGAGGSPTGLITTRGAGDLLTRATWVLFVMFLSLSLALTLLGGRARSDQATLNGLKNLTVNPDALRKPASATPAGPPIPASPAPTGQGVPLPVQLPPLGGPAPRQGPVHRTPVARPDRAPSARASAPAPAATAGPAATPAPLALPPLTTTPPPLAVPPVSSPATSGGPGPQ
jgi:preprotein translocase subunit SecG